MKNPTLAAKKLGLLLKKIGPVEPPEFPNSQDPVATLVMSMLMWESTTDRAQAAYARLMERLVDFNDLRVCMPHETLELLGPRYPRVLDRCQRLRAVLRNIYLREHAVNLHRLETIGKREVKKYVESLEGIVPYAASRMLLLSYDIHTIPVDDQLRIQLIEAEAADASVEIPELSNWLSLQIKAGEGAAAHSSLQSWIDEIAGRPSGEKKPSKRAGGRPAGQRDSRGSARVGAS